MTLAEKNADMNVGNTFTAFLALCLTAVGAANNLAAEKTGQAGKLTAAEAAEVMGFEIGKWEGTVRFEFPGIEPIDAIMTWDYRWQEKGKSIKGTVVTTNEQGGGETGVIYEKFDEERGVIVIRTYQGLKPETVSHRRYFPGGRTLYDTIVQSTPGLPPGVKMISRTKLIGADGISFTSGLIVEGMADGKPLYSAIGQAKRLKTVAVNKPAPKNSPPGGPQTPQEVLQAFVGGWDSETTWIPGGDPTKAETTKLIRQRKWSPGKAFVVEQAVPDDLVWVLTYDPGKKNYRSVVVSPTITSNIYGSWDAVKQVMTWRGKYDDGNTSSGSHRVFDDGHHAWGLEVMREGQSVGELYGTHRRRPGNSSLPKDAAAEEPQASNEVLQLYVGSWDTEAKATMLVDGVAKEQTTKLVSTWKWSPGEKFIVYQSSLDDGVGVIAYDPQKENYRNTFITPFFTSNVYGSWDGAKRVMTWQGKQDDGKPVSGWHRVIDEDHHEGGFKVMNAGRLMFQLQHKHRRRADAEK